MIPVLPGFDLDAFVRTTLAEDLGPTGRDVTSESVIPADARFAGTMDSRDAIVVAGLPVAAAFFRHLDPAMKIDVLAEEGAAAPAGTQNRPCCLSPWPKPRRRLPSWLRRRAQPWPRRA